MKHKFQAAHNTQEVPMKYKFLNKTSLLMATAIFTASASQAQSSDWTGAYLGSEAGGTHFKLSAPGASANDDRLIAGIIGGYDYDLGTWIVGVGTDYDFSDVDFGGTNFLESVWRLKLRSGYKIGSGLFYATGGYANAQFDTISDQNGYFIGGGYDYKFLPNISIGGEVLYTRFDNLAGTPVDGDMFTYQVRGAFRF
jgi:opacity protein-like surface antigen